MTGPLVLVSHVLCPYVQRAAIVLAEKDVLFERRDIDLGNKPDWFLKVSPLGKTPVLIVDGEPIFESAVICEYLEETTLPRLHPTNSVRRAQHRGWMEFSSAVLNVVGQMYNAPDGQSLGAKVDNLKSKFAQVEHELSTCEIVGAYFCGHSFSMVDVAFAPVFRYFDVFETIEDFGFFTETPRVNDWRTRLQQRQSVRNAVRPDYPDLLRGFLKTRGSELSRRIG